MGRLDKDRQEKLEPQRINSAIERLKKLGLEITQVDSTKIVFLFKGNKIQFYPYSGWHTGKGIKDGRGSEDLFRQLQTNVEFDAVKARFDQISNATVLDSTCLINIAKAFNQRQEVARRISSASGKDFDDLNDYFDHLNDNIKTYLAL